MKITLDLTQEAVEAYAKARNKGDNEMTDAEFLQACIVNDIQEVIGASMLAEAQAKAAEDVVVPDVLVV